MDDQYAARPPMRRAPLGEATRRVNNARQYQQNQVASKASSMPHHESLRNDGLLQVHNPSPGSPHSQGDYHPLQEFDEGESPTNNVANPRLSAISKELDINSNRNSQISTVSTNASDGKRIKSYIGPWKLGKTLGKGATARVRLARHAYTGQEAAIKIVQKKNAQISQAGSLAALDQAESTAPDSGDGLRRMPVGIEREVAIMKLIQHPNIMKLYDIWENRTEIYLVLEYADNGELFEHISARGRLEEEEAMKYFRQILSAVGYCHSFNICHRDLKPENILMSKDGDVKIADFGMAALHQSPDHKLKTSCGSPHYAAPEIIRGATYRGDKVDIWSLGVILYATLAGRLPFDVEGGRDFLQPLLAKIRKGAYEMPPEFSGEAQSLIFRILQVNPRDRINLSQIWRHPLLRKYDYLDDLGGGCYPQSPSAKDIGRPVLRRSEVNKELLRHLRSMWHRLTEQQLTDALLSEEPNDQKLFYSLLLKYRDAQLENYTPDLGYSSSDYHHVKPLALQKTYSTCHFPQAKSNGHGRQVSRFTVISNAAETEQSYDPFKASRPQHLDSVRPPDHAKITIHRKRSGDHEEESKQVSKAAKARQSSRMPAPAADGSGRGRQQNLAPPKTFASRSSIASSTRSRSSAHMRAPVGHKRGVSFSHIRKGSGSSQKKGSVEGKSNAIAGRHSNHTDVTDDGVDNLRAIRETPTSTRYIRSRKAQSSPTKPLHGSKPSRASQLWTDDVRQLSSSLAKDCDEAFNRSSVISEVEALNKAQPSDIPYSSSARTSVPKRQFPVGGQLTSVTLKHNPFDSRPLPPPPARSDSVNIELMEARKHAEIRKYIGGDESPGYLDRMVSHIDRLIQPPSPVQTFVDRRASSAPVDTKHIVSTRPLPSIHEAYGEEASPRRKVDLHKFSERKSSRVASAPEPRVSNRHHYDDRFTRPDSNVRDTIRVVQPSSPGSPVKAPAPLTIRKKSSQGGPQTPMTMSDNSSNSSRRRPSGLELRQQYQAGSKLDVATDLGRIDEDHHNDDQFGNESTGTIVKKKPGWFKRNSKLEDDYELPMRPVNPMSSQLSDTMRPRVDAPLPMPPKKKGFSFGKLFKKRSSRPDMTVTSNDIFDDDASVQDSIVEAQSQSHAGRYANYDDPRARQIEPQRNWLAKLFNVKPASKFICFSVSKRRARQEIMTILKEWKRYGIRDVMVDKERNIVFGKVAAQNYLDMKGVAFAGEIMTVIEHGKRPHLSIARFTQERGAASSFIKVVETLEQVLRCRGMLVSDERKARMMIKTLNAV